MDPREREWLKHFERVTGAPFESIESAEVVFNGIRPDRQLAVRIFEPFPCSDALSRRFLEILDWSGETDENRREYLFNHRPQSASDDRLRELVREYRNLVSIIDGDISVDGSGDIVVRFPDPFENYRDDYERGTWVTSLHEPIADRFVDEMLYGVEPEVIDAVHFLLDPLYFLGCDYRLAYYVVFGLVEDRFDSDPFRPLVELWRHGADAAFLKDQDVIGIYAPEGQPSQ